MDKEDINRLMLLKERFFAFIIGVTLFTIPLSAKESRKNTNGAQSMVITDLLGLAKKNTAWKTAVITGEQEQIVFMNVSIRTNPKNEIGDETHAFDQAILIVEGNAQCVLNGKTSHVKSGDLIFIPRGTLHNVINLEKDKDLKIISFYSATDMPTGVTYKTKAEQSED